MSSCRLENLPASLPQFREALKVIGIPKHGKLGDIRRPDTRAYAERYFKLDGTPRAKPLALSGSNAKIDDAIYLRVLFEPWKKDQIRMLTDSPFLSDESFKKACMELGLKGDLDTGLVKVMLPPGDDLDAPTSTDLHVRSSNTRGTTSACNKHEMPALGAPQKVTRRQMMEPYTARRNVPYLRDLDDFIKVLGVGCPRGSGEMFHRKDPGVFYAAAKVYETYKTLVPRRNLDDFAPIDTEIADQLDDFNRTPSRGPAAHDLISAMSSMVSEDTEDDDEMLRKGTRTGRPDEERITNFVTAYLNGLSAYHHSTRGLCTMIPDRAGYTVVMKRDPKEDDEPTDKNNAELSSVFAAHVDGLIPRKTGQAGPVTSKLSPNLVLMTAEYKPPTVGDNAPHQQISPQLAFEIAARIAAMYFPRARGKPESKFTGTRYALAMAVCGFECVLLLAKYRSVWLDYIQNSSSRVWKTGITEDDFLQVEVVSKVDMLHENDKVHLLNALILGILIEEYDDGEPVRGTDSGPSGPSLFGLRTPESKPRLLQLDSAVPKGRESLPYRSGPQDTAPLTLSDDSGTDSEGSVSDVPNKRVPDTKSGASIDKGKGVSKDNGGGDKGKNSGSKGKSGKEGVKKESRTTRSSKKDDEDHERHKRPQRKK